MLPPELIWKQLSVNDSCFTNYISESQPTATDALFYNHASTTKY